MKPEILSDIECEHCTDEYFKPVGSSSVDRLTRTQSPYCVSLSLRCNPIRPLLMANGMNIKIPQKSCKVKAIKQVIISRLPSILCLHLKRNVLNSVGFVTKNGSHVTFPLSLNMEKYFRCGGENNVDADFDTDILRPSQCNVNHSLYDLKSVIVHIGSSQLGSYFPSSFLSSDNS